MLAAPSTPLPPGDPGLPFLGETLAFLGDTSRFLQERSTRRDPVFRARILGDDVVCLGGQEGLERFLDDR